MVQLMADVPTLIRRVHARERGESLRWHEARARELAEDMAKNTWPDLQLDASKATPTELVAKIWDRIK